MEWYIGVELIKSKMTANHLRLLIVALTVCASIKSYAQCDTGSEPECECATAEILCSINELDGYSFSMSDFQHPQDGPDPLCNGNNIPNNPTWFSFIAWCEELELTVEISNCTTVPLPPFFSTFGAQVGVYSDCSTFAEVDCIGNDCGNEDDKVLDLQNLTIGAVYHFMIDGCAGSACDVVISVDGMCTEEIEDWTNEEITGDLNVCVGDEIDYTVDDLEGATSYHWYVDGSEIDETADPENSIVWSNEGTYMLCVDVSNACVSEADDPMQICETVTVSDPDAGMITASPNPLCPDEISDVEVTGYNSDSGYEQVIIVVDDTREVVEVITGSSTTSVTYDACGTFTVYSLNYPTGENITVPSVGSSYFGSDCVSNCCDEVSEDIIFEDDEEPEFDMEPADITVSCYADVLPPEDLLATDNCAADAMVAATETDNSDMCDGGTIIREWEFTDNCGNSVMHTQTITIEGIEAPELINPPGDIVISCDETVPPPIDLSYTNGASGACLIEGMITPVVNGTFDICGTIITYEWEFTDMCGNDLIHTQTIEIEPAEDVIFLNPPANMILNCEDPIPPALDLDYSNADSGPCLIEGSVSPTTNGTFDACGATIVNTWEFTDACNNTIEHEQTIIIRPAEQAEFVNPPSDITLACDDFLNYTIEDLDYTNNSTGACEIMGSVSPTITDNTNNCGGNIEVDYEYTDDCGREIQHSQSITIDPPPMATFLTLPPDITVQCDEIPNPADGLDYTNSESGICLIEGIADVDIVEDLDVCGGAITNTWEFEDDCGRLLEHVQTITIEPAPEAEFLSFPPNMTMDCAEFDAFTPETLAYSNGKSGICLIEGDVEADMEGDVDECGGVMEFIWEYEDNCNRVIMYTQVITVNPAPEAQFINVPSDVTVDCDEANEDPEILQYDNGEGGICEIQGFVEGVPNGSVDACGGSVEMVWTFVDNCGRLITASQNIDYLPAPEPEFDELPEDMVIDCDEDLPDPDPLFYDNGEDDLCEISGDAFPIEDVDDNIYTYTWSYTNPCTGFTIEHTQTLELLIPVDLEEEELEFEICIGNEVDLSDILITDLNNTDPEFTYHDDLPPDSGNEIDPEFTLEDDYIELYIVGTNEYGCFDAVEIFIFADEEISAGEDLEVEACLGSELLDLYSYLEPPASLDGEFILLSGPYDLDLDFGDEVDVSEAEAGTYVLEYFVESFNTCPSDMAEFILELQAEPIIELLAIDCQSNGDFYNVTISNSNYDIEISAGQIDSETEEEVTIINIPIDVDIQIDLEVSGTDCMNSYTYISPDCDCPMVESPISNGNQIICLGEPLPVLSVAPAAETTINWYDALTGGNLLLADSDSYLPQVNLPGTFSFYAEAESTIQEDCFGPFRIEVQLTINPQPAFRDSFVLVCDLDRDGVYSFERADLDTLILPNENLNIEYYENILDLNNNTNALVFPYSNTTAYVQNILALIQNNGNCSDTINIALLVNGVPELSANITDESCLGNSDGSVTIELESQSETNSLFLNGLSINETLLMDLAAGSYQLAVVDSLMCSDTLNFNIAEGIELELLSFSSECFDNGTASDPNDDFYEIRFQVSNPINPSGSFDLFYNSTTEIFNYNQTVELLLPADNSIVNFIAEDTELSCQLVFDSGILPPCSTDCLIELTQYTIACQDNGTPADPQDDFYSLTLEASSINGGISQQYILLSNGQPLGTFNYNETTSLDLAADGMSIDLLLQDVDIISCTLLAASEVLTPCSDQCLLELSDFSYQCNDNGTIQDNNDDFYTYSFVLSGFNTSDSFSISGFNNNFAYEEIITIDSVFITDGIQNLTLSDLVDNSCELNLDLDQTSACSDPCIIELIDLQIGTCDNNNTANSTDDDTYQINFTVVSLEGDMSTISVIDNLGNNYGVFNYDEVIAIADLPADGSTIEFTITDDNFNQCVTLLEVMQEACSVPCNIELQIVDISCNDNGTLDSNDDDSFDAIISVNGTGTSIGYSTNLGFSGTYPSNVELNDLLIQDGDIFLEFLDDQFTDCSQNITIQAPPPCSQPCTIEFDTFQILECNDAGTGTDPQDDSFAVQFSLNVTDGNFDQYVVTDDLGMTFGPFDYNELIEIGPFPADNSLITLSFTDLVNATCFIDTTVTQESCSDQCIIDIEVIDVICNDNNTPETHDDDLYSVSFQVTGINTSAGFEIQNTNSTGNYNEIIVIEGLPVSDDINILVNDLDDPSCQMAVTVPAPEPCSTPCDLLLETLVSNDCNDNGTGDNNIDDFFDIEFVIDNVLGAGNTYVLISNGVEYGPFEYNTLQQIGPLVANGQVLVFELYDMANPVCGLNFEVVQQSCSECNESIEIMASESILNCGIDQSLLQVISSTSNIQSLSWEGPNGFSEDQESITVFDAGDYEVTALFENGCSASALVQIEDNFETPVASGFVDGILNCSNDTVALQAFASGITDNSVAEWQDEDGNIVSTALFTEVDQPGSYFLILTDTISGCSSVSSELIVEANLTEPAVVIYAEPSNIFDCKITSIELSTDPQDNTLYNWIIENELISEGLSIVVNNPSLVSLVALDTISLCSQEEVVDLQDFTQYPDIELTGVDDFNCEFNDICVELITITFDQQFELNWYDSDNNLIAQDESIVCFTEPGDYWVELTDLENNCSNTDSFMLDTPVVPELTLPQVLNLELGDNYQFSPELNIPAGQLTQIIWEADAELSCYDCLEPIVTAFSDGDIISLTVISEDGCESTAETRIRVEEIEEVSVYIPNVFAPGNSNANNFTIFTSEEIEVIQDMYIYDRWGELIFTNQNFQPNRPELGWDGYFGEGKAEQGVYVYLFVFENNGRIERRHGDVTLLW